MNDVVVRLCGNSAQGDELKRQANKIAYAMKKSQGAKAVKSLRVSNYTSGEPSDAAKLRSDDFQMNTYEPGLDEGVALSAWKTADQS